ncbi:MAG: hypothetical protein KJ063_25340 [Anaerolineae bacterium]|nr:hypothetical protein [Anaerolineae bacterium]
MPKEFNFETDPQEINSDVEAPSHAFLTEMHQLLVRHFSQEELKTLCFNLGIDFDDLDAVGRTHKARELVQYMGRRGRIEELTSIMAAERPNLLSKKNIGQLSFGHLYLPTYHGGVFRDEFYFADNQLYLSFYQNSGATSQAISSFESVDVSQIGPLIGVKPIIDTASKLIRIVSEVWEKLAWFHSKPEEMRRNLWPKSLAYARGDLQDLLMNNLIALRSDKNLQVNKKMLDEAERELFVFRVAFSEDLVNLYNHLVKIEKGCFFELNLASPKSLFLACQNELTEIAKLEEVAGIFSALESQFDIQARSKYLLDAQANFARAACDSLCAVRAAQNYLQYLAGFENARRFTLRLYDGEPSFRGNITDSAITYVSTTPWVPGMMGDLHAHILHKTDEDLWKEAKSKFLLETGSMRPVKHDYYSAVEQLLPEIITAIHAAPRRQNVSREEVFELEKMVKNIDFLKPTSTTDVMNTFDKIQNHRIALRSKFGEIYSRLDEAVLK